MVTLRAQWLFNDANLWPSGLPCKSVIQVLSGSQQAWNSPRHHVRLRIERHRPLLGLEIGEKLMCFVPCGRVWRLHSSDICLAAITVLISCDGSGKAMDNKCVTRNRWRRGQGLRNAV